MFDGIPHKDELNRRVDTIRRMLDVGDPTPLPVGPIDIGREIRGVSILLLFASYENLLKSVCRSLLDIASGLRVGNRRLKPGFRQFAVHDLFISISDSGESAIWRDAGRKLLDQAFNTKECTINANKFPSDGSFMKTSQVKLFFKIFDLGDPGPILKEVWNSLDAVVSHRNDIAHGAKTPEEIGRNYSYNDIRDLVNSWEARWIEFINHVEISANSRDFFRKK